jgi:hypothetical protein
MSGMTPQVSPTTTQALKTALRSTNGHTAMAGPRVRLRTIAKGKTPGTSPRPSSNEAEEAPTTETTLQARAA